MIENLVTFGCSHTYGAALPDNHPDPRWIDGTMKPSSYAWPEITRSILNIPNLENLGIPRNSPENVFYQFLERIDLFNKSYFLVFLWPSTLRFMMKNNQAEIINMGQGGLHKEKMGLEVNNQAIENYYLNIHSNEVSQKRIYSHILSIQKICEQKNVKNVHFFVTKDNEMTPFKENVELYDKLNKEVLYLKTRFIRYSKKYGVALDKKHVGVEGHKRWAEDIVVPFIDYVRIKNL